MEATWRKVLLFLRWEKWLQYKTLLTGLYSYIIIFNINKKKRRAIRSSCPKWPWQLLSTWHLLILSFFRFDPKLLQQTSAQLFIPGSIFHLYVMSEFLVELVYSFIMMNIYWVHFNYFILAKFATLPVPLACHKFLPTFQTAE